MRTREILTVEEALALVRALGLRLIAGAADTPSADPPADDPPPAPDPPADPPPPDPAEQNARLREENARLQGELTGLRAQQPTSTTPAEAKTPPLTAEAIETAFAASQISDARRIQLHSQVAVDAALRTRDEKDARARPMRTAADKLAGYVTKYPDLSVRGSALLTKVSAEMAGVVAEFGFAAEDPRAQVLAVERVVGSHRLGGGDGMDGRDVERRRTPTGGAGSGPAGSGGRGGGTPDPLKEVERLYPEQIRFWQKLGYSEKERRAEAPLVLTRRARRVARTA